MAGPTNLRRPPAPWLRLRRLYRTIASRRLRRTTQNHCFRQYARDYAGATDAGVQCRPRRIVEELRMPSAEDKWSTWLASERTGGDPERSAVILAQTRAVAERVLKRLPLASGDVIADVGCGEGLVGLTALERPGVRVVFTDVSPPLVERARAAVAAMGALDRSTFAVADASALLPLDDASVDGIVSRASLAYVADKNCAFAAAHRVLRPGGRLSIAEPILRDAAFRLVAMRAAIASAPGDLELLHRWHALAIPDTVEAIRAHPLTNFDERGLLQSARTAGFVNAHLRLHLDEVMSVQASWNVMLATALVPGSPTLGAALDDHYSAEERARFEQRFRPMFERGLFPPEVRATAYLWASR